MLDPQDDNHSKRKAIDPELAHKAKLLRLSNLFVDPAEGSALVHKQNIFLVLAGLKPVSEASSGHWLTTASGRHTVADDPEEVGRFLESLGLTYDLHKKYYVTNAVVALTKKVLDRYLGRTSGSGPAGHLLGYPDTAVTAFIHDECMTMDEQDRVEEGADLHGYIVPFRFSLAHWQTELAVVRQWRDTLMVYGLL